MGQPWVAVAGEFSYNKRFFNQQVFIGLKAAKSTKEFYQLNANLTEEQLLREFLMHIFRFYCSRTEKYFRKQL